MLYIFGTAVALLIVVAQSLWKAGLEHSHFLFTKDYLLSAQMIKAMLSPYIIGGVLLYVVATVGYFGLLVKYQYSHAQTIVVVSSLIFTFISAAIVFSEHFRAMNILGLCLLLAGVVLVTRF